MFRLRDKNGTCWDIIPTTDGIDLVLSGDSECHTLIDCLRFAADELERQMRANHLEGKLDMIP